MKNKKLKLFLIYMLLPILMVITTSFAWFYINQQVEVNYTPEIECEAGHSLEISLDGGKTWSGSATLTTPTPKMLDITGDGITLYKPLAVVAEGDKYVPEGFELASKIDPETGEGDFIEIEVMLRTNSKMDVYLSGDSYVNPISEGSASYGIYGPFSKNNIAGAVRVAVTEKDSKGAETRKMLWDPNPYYNLTRKADGTYTFNKEQKTSNVDASNYQYYTLTNSSTNTYSITKFSMQDIVDKKISLGNVGGKDEVYAGDSPILTSFLPTSDQEMITKTLIIRVWFEGTDREADQALSGGVIKMYFKFNGVNKSKATAANQALIDKISYSNRVFSNIQKGFEYSYNGFEWHVYNGETFNIDTYKTWYWRYPETESNLASEYKIITI